MQGFHDHYSRAVNCQIFVRLRSRAHIKKAWTNFYHFKLANRQLITVDARLVIMMATRKCSDFFSRFKFAFFIFWYGNEPDTLHKISDFANNRTFRGCDLLHRKLFFRNQICTEHHLEEKLRHFYFCDAFVLIQ